MNKLFDRIPAIRDNIAQTAPAVFATRPDDSVATEYRFVPTIDIVEKLNDHGWLPSTAHQNPPLEYDKGVHCVRFRQYGKMSENDTEVPEIVLVNSHNGETGVRIYLGIHYFASFNQIVVDNSEDLPISLPHRRKGIAESVVDTVMGLAEHDIPNLMLDVGKYKLTYPSKSQIQAFAAQAALIRWPDEETERYYTYQSKEISWYPSWKHLSNDSWSVFNRVYENLIQGGVARPIRHIGTKIKYSRKLWKLAESSIFSGECHV